MKQIIEIFEYFELQTVVLKDDKHVAVFCDFMQFLLGDPQHGTINYAANKKVVQDVADLYSAWKRTGKKPDKKKWTAAAAAAYAAAAAHYAHYARSAQWQESRAQHLQVLKNKLISLVIQHSDIQYAVELNNQYELMSLHEVLALKS